MASLSDQDQAAVRQLFQNPPQRASARQTDPASFRITRSLGDKDETVEVPDALVPEALKACVTDELK